MNIFVTDLNPILCAINLDDKRVVKMALETTQILSTILGGPYKPTHIHHPCVLWAKESEANLAWTYRHGIALLCEYSHRFNARIHACMQHYNNFQSRISTLHSVPDRWVVCPSSKGWTDDPTDAYKKKILNVKWNNDKRPPIWTKRSAPFWRDHNVQSL